jgi:hypothetical protein
LVLGAQDRYRRHVSSQAPAPRLAITNKRDLLLMPLRIGNALLRRDRHAHKYALRWLKSVAPGADPLNLRVPWICFGAIDWLQDNLRPGWRVLELGSGGSTCFLSDRGAQLTSLEHDPEWFDRVAQALAPGTVVDQRLVDEDRFVDEMTALPSNAFDLVLVDGGADRAAAVLAAQAVVKPGGFIMLDNCDAPGLWQALTAMGPPTHSFHGIAPWNLHRGRVYLQETCIWQRGSDA